MAEVTSFPIRTEGKETPERILEIVSKWEGVDDLLVIADVDGEIWSTGTMNDLAKIVLMLELAKKKIIEME